jgi:hypothetical protein
MPKEVKCQPSNRKRRLLPWQMQPQEESGKWMKRNFVRQIIKPPRKSSFHQGFAAIPNGFENRIRQLELVNCLLSGSARKVNLISEILDGRKTESEIINKTPP